ncbi:hypothetical protein I317_02915 [Kwoniella heveanensis CBS 569]|nr:hypothetical protein I317_02915 [Kwoniella heveanensis CBS 569]
MSDRGRGRSRTPKSLSPSRSPSRSLSRSPRRRSISRDSRSRSRTRSPRKPAANGNGKSSAGGFRVIVVSGLSKNVLKGHLEEIFGEYGRITGLDLPLFKVSGLNRGKAAIEFERPLDAQKAVKHMDGGQLDGSFLSVQLTPFGAFLANNLRSPNIPFLHLGLSPLLYDDEGPFPALDHPLLVEDDLPPTLAPDHDHVHHFDAAPVVQVDTDDALHLALLPEDTETLMCPLVEGTVAHREVVGAVTAADTEVVQAEGGIEARCPSGGPAREAPRDDLVLNTVEALGASPDLGQEAEEEEEVTPGPGQGLIPQEA